MRSAENIIMSRIPAPFIVSGTTKSRIALTHPKLA
jgi:hypothetical protein